MNSTEYTEPEVGAIVMMGGGRNPKFPRRYLGNGEYAHVLKPSERVALTAAWYAVQDEAFFAPDVDV